MRAADTSLLDDRARITSYNVCYTKLLRMRTEDNPRFGEEKILPGIAYIRSEVFAQRFGYRSGRWLVVTTGERRMLNMKQQAERVGGASARLFYRITSYNVCYTKLLRNRFKEFTFP